jgi:hypothetical protein
VRLGRADDDLLHRLRACLVTIAEERLRAYGRSRVEAKSGMRGLTCPDSW